MTIPIIGENPPLVKPKRKRAEWQKKFIEGTLIPIQGESFRVVSVWDDGVLFERVSATGQEKKRSGKLESSEKTPQGS